MWFFSQETEYLLKEAEHRPEKDMSEQIARLNNNILSRIGGMSQQLTNGSIYDVNQTCIKVVGNLMC